MKKTTSTNLFNLMIRFCVLIVFLISGCSTINSQKLGTSYLIFYDWDGDMPESVLRAFEREFGIQVDYKTYESQEEAIENMRKRRIYDVVVMDSGYIPILVQEYLLTELNYSNLPNAKNISPAFRDLVYDPGNQFSIPYTWGSTALLVSGKVQEQNVSRWADLWNPRFQNRIGIWKGTPREILAVALKSLGYSANSEDPAELEAALQQLLLLKPHLKYLEDYYMEDAAPAFIYGNIVLAVGYSYDHSACQAAGLDVRYVYPEEGSLLWGDTYIIPANSPRQAAAEAFINFLLRPQISAQISNENSYASANSAALPFIDSEIVNNPAIYPPDEVVEKAEILFPLSPAGQALYDQTWARFLAYIP